jgi:hypothetical protein
MFQHAMAYILLLPCRRRAVFGIGIPQRRTAGSFLVENMVIWFMVRLVNNIDK